MASLTVLRAQSAQMPAVVLQPEDTFDPVTEPIKGIRTGGNDNTCSYAEILQILRAEARKAGANLVKITRRSERGKDNSCETVEADFYKVPDPKQWETEFSWSRARRLTWSDFRGEMPPGKGGTAAETACGIGFETNSVSGSNPVEVFVYNSFSRVDSWVRPGVNDMVVLQHEQGHFDLCELYTRRFRERLSKIKVTGKTMKTVLPGMYNKLQQEYIERQQDYERDTRHGIDDIQQRRWQRIIAEELEETEAWSSTGLER